MGLLDVGRLRLWRWGWRVQHQWLRPPPIAGAGVMVSKVEFVLADIQNGAGGHTLSELGLTGVDVVLH